MRVAFILFAISLFHYSGQASGDDTLEAELRAIDSLRRGLNTPLDEVHSRGKMLLQKYDRPEDQALIFCQLAHTYAQSGMTRPDRVLEFCEEALKLPLPPAKKLLLFIYGGDACQAINRVLKDSEKQDFPETRRNATKWYVDGLLDSQKYSLPEVKPSDATRGNLEMVIGDADDPEFQRRVKEYNQENADFEERRKKAQQDQQAWEYRRVLYDQIVYLYLRQPTDDAEFHELATRLPDPMSEVLLKRFSEKSPMRQSPPARSVSPESKSKGDDKTAPGFHGRYLLVVGNFLVLGCLALYFYRRREL